MWILPLAAAVVASLFAAMLLRRASDRRRPYRILWGIAMIMYAVASASVALGAANGWGRGTFFVYWAVGAVLNVPFLAAGEIVLLLRRSVVLALILLVLLGVSIATIAIVAQASVDPHALERDLPSGKLVFGPESAAFGLPQLISIPSYLLLVIGALWSAWSIRGGPGLRDRFVGTLLIVLGATVTAVAGSAFAAEGNLPAFSVALLAGITVMFWGFLRASRTPVPPPPSRG